MYKLFQTCKIEFSSQDNGYIRSKCMQQNGTRHLYVKYSDCCDGFRNINIENNPIGSKYPNLKNR